jgi:hypothetical protein
MKEDLSIIKIGNTTLTLVCNDHGFADYDVVGHPQSINRAKIRPDLNFGDIFNVYSGKSTKSGVEWLGSVEVSLYDTCLTKHGMSSKMRAKIVSENQARKKIDAMFVEYEKSKGIRLHTHYCSNSHKKVLFEGYNNYSWPTNSFKNTFDSYVDMKKYFYAIVVWSSN